MSKKLSLDNKSHLHLLTSLFDMEEMLEGEEYKKLGKALEELIEEVRYSDIVESYELMKD